MRTENKEQCYKQEMEFCLQLFNTVLEVEVGPGDIKKTMRFGSRNSGTKRPLLVQLRTRAIKNAVMESLWKLKGAEEKYRCLSICHDMTKSERDELKRLVAQAKHKEEEEGKGEWIFRVRGPPEKLVIVRLPAPARH